MARYSIAGTTGTSENTIVFIPSGGHSHNGQNSSLIDTSAYSVYDFSPTFVGTDINPERAIRQENNRIALEDLIKRVVNNSVLAPAGIRLDPGSLNGSLIAANTITASQLAANTITADEIAASTITANQLTSNIVLVNNSIQSSVYTAGSAGWRISNTGSAEFNNVTVRGTVAATAGNIAGWTINSSNITGGSTVLYNNGTAVFGNTTIYSNGRITNGNFTVSASGVLSATSASISGTITAGSGSTIGGWNIYTSTLESSSGGTILYGSGAMRVGTPDANSSDYATISNSADFTVYGYNGAATLANAGVTRMYGAFMNIKKGNNASASQPNLQMTHNSLTFFDSSSDTCGISGGNDGGTPNMYVYGGSSYMSAGGYMYAGDYIHSQNSFRCSVISGFTTGYDAVWTDDNPRKLAFTAWSSQRFKNSISEITNGDPLDPMRLLDLKVIKFKYNNDYLVETDPLYDKFTCGLLAEDVYEKYPTVAILDSEKLPTSISYTRMIPPMVGILKTLNNRINELEQEITVLKTK